MLEHTFYAPVNGYLTKFSIFRLPHRIDGKIVYYCRIINTELDIYQNLEDVVKNSTFGVHVTDGNQGVIFYSSRDEFEADLRELYGIARLQSKI